MKEWKELRKECYGQDIYTDYKGGFINFNPESMNDVENGEFRSYDEYLDVQMHSCGKTRKYFELCYFYSVYVDFAGQILRFDKEKTRVLFKRIMINGAYCDGITFYGKEDHVWMEKSDFEGFKPGDCVSFEAEIYRYMRKKMVS